MPARDTYHDVVVKALTADGWTITHDPLPLVYGDQDLKDSSRGNSVNKHIINEYAG